MTLEQARLRQLERWIAWIRLGAIPWVVLEVGVLTRGYPAGYERLGWLLTGILVAGAIPLFVLSGRELSARAQRDLSLSALGFDTLLLSGYALVYAFEPGTPIRQLLVLPVAGAALRFGVRGGIALPALLVPVLVAHESWRTDRFGDGDFVVDHVTFPLGVLLLLGLVIGRLKDRFAGEADLARSREGESDRLRHELARRADALEAANRCARALSSSLDVDEAFLAFIRELQGLIPHERMAIVLAEGDSARVIAAAGAGADSVFPPGSRRPTPGSLLEEVMKRGQTVYRPDIGDRRHPEEEPLLALGLHARVGAPLFVGARPIGMLALVRAEPDSFTDDQIELVGLLGRFVGSAVQNIRAYDSERRTVDELRRLSALRADFVSLVSHELRSPMASIIGAAQTLQDRWRDLSSDQRDAFLGLVVHETSRLNELVGDVLDTSRIEAGTFSYAFREVDLGQVIRDAVEAARTGQQEVSVRTSVEDPLPRLRGDRERLRQVLTNLLDNAVKFSPEGGEVLVEARSEDGSVRIEVSDQGRGIAREDHELIFEKFGRGASGGVTKPGTGLGLFIARSIAEAHGGRLEVVSAPERGATFTLELPLDAG